MALIRLISKLFHWLMSHLSHICCLKDLWQDVDSKALEKNIMVMRYVHKKLFDKIQVDVIFRFVASFVDLLV